MSKRLSYEYFLKSFEYAPRLTIELIVENNEGKILLLKRNTNPFKGKWHLPGGFLMKDEKLSDCIRRIAFNEVSIEKTPKQHFLGIFENLDGDPRGHILHYVVKLSENVVKKGKYFKTTPKNNINYQMKFLNKLGYS